MQNSSDSTPRFQKQQPSDRHSHLTNSHPFSIFGTKDSLLICKHLQQRLKYPHLNSQQ